MMNHKIKKRSAFYVGFLFILLFQKNSFSEVIKQSDSLYTEWVKLPIKAADKNNPKQQGDVLFVMQRLDEDPKALDFWKNLVQKEMEEKKRVHFEKFNELPGDRQIFHSLISDRSKLNSGDLTAGFQSLLKVLNEIPKKDSPDQQSSYEVWISWAMSPEKPEKKEELQGNEKQSEKEPGFLKNLQAKEIEIVVSVSTIKQSPMVTHMGINRFFSYLTESKAPVHESLSTQIHAFSARCMLQRYPDKTYMITAPVPAMREILEKAIPNECILDPWSSFYTQCQKQGFPKLQKLKDQIKELEEKEEESREAEERRQETLRDLNKEIKELRKDKNFKIEETLAFNQCMNRLYEKGFNHSSTQTKMIFFIRYSELKADIEKSIPVFESQIYTPNGKELLFHHYRKGEEEWIKSRSSAAQKEFEQTTDKDQIKKQWGWFFHPDMPLNTKVAIPLKALAGL